MKGAAQDGVITVTGGFGETGAKIQEHKNYPDTQADNYTIYNRQHDIEAVAEQNACQGHVIKGVIIVPFLDNITFTPISNFRYPAEGIGWSGVLV